MKIINEIKQRAKKIAATIILPEANIDKRVYDACLYILENKLSKIIVLGKTSDFDERFQDKNCQIIDIENYAELDKFAQQLYELRKKKGMTLDEAKVKVKSPDYFSCMMLYNNLADGMVAGATWTTGDTLRPALQIVKTKPDKSIVTGVMLMVKDRCAPLVFGDVSLIENPSEENLADIAISSAEFMKSIFDIEPKVAMLSYSTKGSAKSEMVDKVRNATVIANKKSKFLIDGEMQVDSALDEKTAKKKGITSAVGGNANVLIFPDLNAGNIGYKLVARLGGYTAVGPIMLNFNKPVNDLSRGCTVDEIVSTVCITKLLTDTKNK